MCSYPRWDITFTEALVNATDPIFKEGKNLWFLERLPTSCSLSQLGHWTWPDGSPEKDAILLLAPSALAGWPDSLGPSPPRTASPGSAELRGGKRGQATARHGALKHRPVRSGWTAPLPGLRGGGQGILLSPFSRSAISCPVPAPGMLHLLLLNHFLFTACLLQPPSSQAAASSQQPRAPRMDEPDCLDRQGWMAALWVGGGTLVLPFR